MNATPRKQRAGRNLPNSLIQPPDATPTPDTAAQENTSGLVKAMVAGATLHTKHDGRVAAAGTVGRRGEVSDGVCNLTPAEYKVFARHKLITPYVEDEADDGPDGDGDGDGA